MKQVFRLEDCIRLKCVTDPQHRLFKPAVLDDSALSKDELVEQIKKLELDVLGPKMKEYFEAHAYVHAYITQ